MPAPQRPPATSKNSRRSPAERAEEFAAEQARLKSEAAARREAAAAAKEAAAKKG